MTNIDEKKQKDNSNSISLKDITSKEHLELLQKIKVAIDVFKKYLINNIVIEHDFINKDAWIPFYNNDANICKILIKNNNYNLKEIDNNSKEEIIKLIKPYFHILNKDALFVAIDDNDEVDSFAQIFLPYFLDILSTDNLIAKSELDKIEEKKTRNKVAETVSKNGSVDRNFTYLGNKRFASIEKSNFNVIDNGGEKIDLLNGEERNKALKIVSDKIDNSLSKFFDSAYENNSDVHLLKAPTGSGKTSRFVSNFISDKRTYEDISITIGNKTINERRPIVILMPNHQNISEAVSRAKMLCLDDNLPDDKLAQELVNVNFCEDIDAAYIKLEEARESIRMCGRDKNLPPINISVLTSRIRSGCKKKDKAQQLANAGIGQSSLCFNEIKNKETGKIETQYCEYYEECPFIKARNDLHKAHVVFMPHAYATNKNIPEEIMKPRMVVIDERIQEQILKFCFMSLAQLSQERKRSIDMNRDSNKIIPSNDEEAEKLIKREVKYKEFLHKERARIWCVEKLVECSLKNEDPAQFFIKLQEEYISNFDKQKEIIEYDDNGIVVEKLPSPISCIDLSLSCLNECSKRDPRINPFISTALLSSICSMTGASTIDKERKMWEMIKEGVLSIYKGRGYNEEENDSSLLESSLLANKSYMGKKDYRFQFLNMRNRNVPFNPEDGFDKNTIRISWIEDMNWKDSPLLLLDASAYEPIVERIWRDKKVITTDVVEDFGKLLNVRIVGIIDHSWSNASILATGSSSFAQLTASGVSLASLRDATSVISAAHADGRVLVAGSKSVRKALQHNWIPSGNIDTCHFGAVRGIDEWKYHSATISIGRMDLPVEVIDAMAACLTWDEETPELPFNIHGNGFSDIECSKPLFQSKFNREIRMRDGRSATFGIPMVSGKWGQLCQKQSREEELLQFLGRLRPIYRKGKVPVHYTFSAVIPDGLILDDCVTIHDIIGDDKSGLLSKDKQEDLIDKKWLRDRENQAVITRILDTSMRIHGGIICPEVLVNDVYNLDIESKYRNIKSIMNFLKMRGFNVEGEISETQSMADGWSLYGYSVSGGIIQPAWVSSNIYKNDFEAKENITKLISLYSNCNMSDIEIGAFNIITPEKEVNVSFDSSALGLLENAEKNIESTNDFIYLLKNKTYIDEQTKKNVYFIKEQSCENTSIPFNIARKKYFIKNALSSLMVPEPTLNGKKSEKDKTIRNYVSNYGLYYHQLMGILALQDINSNSLQSIINRIEAIPGLIDVDNKDDSDIIIETSQNSDVENDSDNYNELDDVDFSEFLEMNI